MPAAEIRSPSTADTRIPAAGLPEPHNPTAPLESLPPSDVGADADGFGADADGFGPGEGGTAMIVGDAVSSKPREPAVGARVEDGVIVVGGDARPTVGDAVTNCIASIGAVVGAVDGNPAGEGVGARVSSPP